MTDSIVDCSKYELLDIFITILTDNHKTKIDSVTLVKLLKDHFNYSVTLNDIINYFEPSVGELELDLRQQMKNIGVRYE